MSIPYRVLLIEDSVQDALFNLRELERSGLTIEFQRVENAPDMRAALEAKSWDFILCDYQLPQFDALAALGLYKERGLDVPFITVSGQIGEEQAVKMIKAGAHEYVMKDHLNELAPAVKRELRAAEERCIRRRVHATESFLASIVQNCDDAVIGETLEGTVVSWNPGAERLYGYTPSEILGGSAAALVPSYRPNEHPEIIQKISRGLDVAHFETVHVHKNGTAVEVSLTVSPVKEPRGRIIGTSTIARDITARKQEENERLALIQELTAALANASHQSAASSQHAIISAS